MFEDGWSFGSCLYNMSSYKNKELYDWFRMSNNQVRATLASTGFSYFSDERLVYLHTGNHKARNIVYQKTVQQ